MQPDTVASVWFVMTGCTMLVYQPGHQSKRYRLGLHSCPGTMALGYVNYAEGLHFSAFHFEGKYLFYIPLRCAIWSHSHAINTLAGGDIPPPACVKHGMVTISPQPAAFRGITDTL